MIDTRRVARRERRIFSFVGLLFVVTKTQNIYQRQWLSDAKNQERFGGS